MCSCYRIPEGRKEIQREKEGMEGEKEGEGKRGRQEGRRRVWMGRRERGRVGGRRGEGKCTVLQSVRATRAAQMVLNRLVTRPSILLEWCFVTLCVHANSRIK